MEAIPVRTILPSNSASHYHGFQRPKRRIKPSPSPLHHHPITKTTSTRYFRFPILAKFSDTDFQDFRSYARPLRLLPASEVNLYTKTSLENVSYSLKEDKSKCLFRIRLGTSNLYGSSISDSNAGVLLCLIDEDGNSILQRIPVSFMMDHSTESGDILNFQRGSVDEFVFEGPKISRLKALWIGVESVRVRCLYPSRCFMDNSPLLLPLRSGQWRLGNVSLMVISCDQQQSSPEDGASWYTGFEYNFQTEDVLLGEGSKLSMLELRPSLVTVLEGTDPSLFKEGLYDSTLLPSAEISKEESMMEYTNLKFSLLFYDAVLIFFGTSIASLSAGENTGFAFLIGGVGGFLYLLLLQRYVDGLPGSELITSNKKGTHALFRGLKGPIVSVALALGFALFVVRYGSGDDLQLFLTPKNLIVGMMGFLACKVSVVLAAFKPISTGTKLPSDM